MQVVVRSHMKAHERTRTLHAHTHVARAKHAPQTCRRGRPKIPPRRLDLEVERKKISSEPRASSPGLPAAYMYPAGLACNGRGAVAVNRIFIMVTALGGLGTTLLALCAGLSGATGSSSAALARASSSAAVAAALGGKGHRCAGCSDLGTISV